MLESKFSEKESIELISQMIKQTRQNMELGSGNIFLYYGYSAVVVSVAVFSLFQLTQNAAWSALWFLMFLPGILIKLKNAKQKPQVVTYMDKAINNTWSIVGSLFALTAVAILLIGYTVGFKFVDFALMLPLCLLYAGIGTSLTGVITNIPILIYTPIVAFIVAIYMLMALTMGETATASWHLYFGISFLVMMVIPGHVLNKKIVGICSKN